VCGSGSSGTGTSNIIYDGRTRNQVSTQEDSLTSVASGNITGTSRALSTGYDWRISGSSGSFTAASSTVSARTFFIFSRTSDVADTSSTPTDARIATYHAGAALNLATLESLQATLISEIAAI
jgi:hypothetical protein